MERLHRAAVCGGLPPDPCPDGTGWGVGRGGGRQLPSVPRTDGLQYTGAGGSGEEADGGGEEGGEASSSQRRRKKREKKKLPRCGARLGYGRSCDPAAVPAVPVLRRGSSDSVRRQSGAFPVALQRRSHMVGLWVRIVTLVVLASLFF